MSLVVGMESGNLGDIGRSHADDDSAVFIEHGDTSTLWTSKQFDQAVNACAHHLSQQDLDKNALIGLIGFNSAAFLINYFAIMRAGFIAVPLNYRLPVETLAYIATDASLQLIVSDGAHNDKLPNGLPVIPMSAHDRRSGSQSNEREPFCSHKPSSQMPCKILYTSGSTGKPKGTILTHYGQLWAINQSLTMPQGQGRRVMVVAPFYHKNGLYFASYALASQTTVISLLRFDPRVYLEAAAEHQCDWLTGIPTMFAMMLREKDLIEDLDFSNVRVISIGSAPLSEALADEIEQAFPNASVLNGYGATEAGPLIFGNHPDRIPRPALSVGHPIPGVDCRLVGGDSSEKGSLHIRAPSMMSGYLNQESLTARKFVDGWYNTGDIFRRDAQGFYFFLGREDDMFVCGGENVYPSEIERLLEKHPSVAQATIVAAPDKTKGDIPIGFIVLKEGHFLSEEDLKEFALTNGPAYSHPRAIVYVDSFPVSGTHKIDRAALSLEARRIADNLQRP